MELRAWTCELEAGGTHKYSAHNILRRKFLKHPFIQLLKLEFLPSQRSPLQCPLRLSFTTFWSLSICVSVYKILIYICPFLKINVLLSFSFVHVGSLARIPTVCSRVRKEEGERECRKAAFGFLPPAHNTPHTASSIYYGQRRDNGALVSPREGKGHRNGCFPASWSSGSSETMMLLHSLCSRMRINLSLDNLKVRASEKHLGLYHHLPLFHIANVKRFYANSSILCVF